MNELALLRHREAGREPVGPFLEEDPAPIAVLEQRPAIVFGEWARVGHEIGGELHGLDVRVAARCDRAMFDGSDALDEARHRFRLRSLLLVGRLLPVCGGSRLGERDVVADAEMDHPRFLRAGGGGSAWGCGRAGLALGGALGPSAPAASACAVGRSAETEVSGAGWGGRGPGGVEAGAGGDGATVPVVRSFGVVVGAAAGSPGRRNSRAATRSNARWEAGVGAGGRRGQRGGRR